MDQYGRPQFGDWMGIAQGLKGVNQDREEQEALAIAQKVAEDPSYKPEGVNPSVAWKGIVEGNRLAADKMGRESAALEMKFKRIKADREEFLSVLDRDVMSLRGVDDKAYVSAAKKAFQAHPNGIDIKDLEDGTVEVTYPNGQKSVRGDFTAKEIDQMIVNYRDPTAGLKQDLAWDEMIREDNFEAEKNAAQLVDKEGNPLPYRAAKVFDKNLKKHYTQYWREDGTPASDEDLKKIHASGAMTSDGLASALKIQKARNDLFGSMLGIQDKQLSIQGKMLDNAGKVLDIKEKQGAPNKPGKDDKYDKDFTEAMQKKYGLTLNSRDKKGNIIPQVFDDNSITSMAGFAQTNGYELLARKTDNGYEVYDYRRIEQAQPAPKPSAPKEQPPKQAPKQSQYKSLNDRKAANFASQYLNSGDAGRKFVMDTVLKAYGPAAWKTVQSEIGRLNKEKADGAKKKVFLRWGDKEYYIPIQGKV